MTTPEADVSDMERKTEEAAGETNENDADVEATINNNLDKNRENEGTSAGDVEGGQLQENGVNNANEENSNPAPQDAPLSQTNAVEMGGETTTPVATNKSTKAAAPNPPAKKAPKASSSTFVHDPNKITLKFLFAGRDGINVIIDCKPNDTVGEVKGALMSVWPKDMPECTGGDRIRLICMGKGILMPDSKTLQAANVPVFKTHPTPINVSVRPEEKRESVKHGGNAVTSSRIVGARDFPGGGAGNGDERGSGNSSAGCCCVVS
ncbi:hypothetical protein HJC23_006891 [Cyclotella cryptica]|uniref:UBL3-like ubiquitin domain-containing protein n=1 Tax=Cyclotella cryptica TaxID=29204 RepID=A0ABD3QBY7_9STRA|eukprot:CCRYP_006716-RA/>CCRYP_006716-RA protein AED:0.29 eAED:0.46 QI:0/0/0/1/1/1/2/0/263